MSTQARAQGSRLTNLQQCFQNIINTLFIEQDPEGAVQLIIDAGPNQAYARWGTIRKKIIHDEGFRQDHYLQQLRQFKEEHFSPQDPQWSLLEELALKPINEQYAVQRAKKPFLKCGNPGLETQLRKINVLQEPFYRFFLPPNYAREKKQRDVERMESKHANSEVVSLSELQTIISIARNWREQDHRIQPTCLMILSGRRMCEVLGEMAYEPDPENNYRAIVWHLAKGVEWERRWTIPLLCPYSEFAELIQLVRTNFPDLKDKPGRSSYVTRQETRVFGSNLGQTKRRSLYAEGTWRERSVNQFMTTATKMMFVDCVLCHEIPLALSGNSTYQAVTFSNE